MTPVMVAPERPVDKADAFYLVSSGKLGVWHRAAFKPKKLATVEEGQYFGDNSLISDSRHSSSVVAETACELFVLRKRDFEEILMANPEMAMKIKAHVAIVKTGGHAPL